MKYWYIGAAALVFAVAAGVLLCRKKTSPNPEIDGGVRHFHDDNAPKEINATEITDFRCKFSTVDLMREDSPIAGHLFTLYACQKEGYFELRDRSKEEGKKTFAPDETFFGELQQIVSQYAFAQHNGQHYRVSGLPPHFGMELEIRYASGEEIRASNNQSCFLPLEAMEALVALFEQKQ